MRIHPYSIGSYDRYSLSQAARTADVPPGRLRRAIVLGELQAEPVADERDYLVSGRHLQEYIRTLRPDERAEFESDGNLGLAIALFFAVPLVMSLICAIPIVESARSKATPRQTPAGVTHDAGPISPHPPGNGDPRGAPLGESVNGPP
jgi:hypothetical protein